MRSLSPARLRVALVVASLRILGGQAVQANRLVKGWNGDPDIDAWVVPIDPVPSAPFDRLLRIKYVRTMITQLWYWPLLIRELRRADVVHVFSASYSSFLLAPLPAIIVSRLLGKPVLLNYHSGEAEDHLRRSWIARTMLRRMVDMNVVPSPYLRDVFARFGIDATVVSNTVDRNEFVYRVRDWRHRPLTLLSTRNFEANYNVACTLRAFARVQACFPDVSLMLVGSGSQEAALKALASAMTLRNVHFAGTVPPERVAGFYASADLYVQTPAVDNMPLSILEAFASGLPVVSTRVGGVPAILTDGEDGLLAPDNDAEGVAARIIELLQRPDFARRLAATAAGKCELYDWRSTRGSWLAVYRALARPDRDGHPLKAQEPA
jgi:glycosyltransferase involved in cell wall biosynthesis